MEKVNTIGKFWHKASIETVAESLFSILQNLEVLVTNMNTTPIETKTIAIASEKYINKASRNS